MSMNEETARTGISFYTLGCRLNQSETAVIQHTCQIKGYRVVEPPEVPDIVVINTCTVTKNGDADTRRLINRIHRNNPSAQIALIGCQAQVQKAKLADLQNVKWVVGNARKMDLAVIFEETLQAEGPHVITPRIDRKSFTVPMTSGDKRHTRANLKIQDGCDFFCSFCEIPYARGRARSREFNDILKEARRLIKAGHQEIVLTGINLGTYEYANKNIVDIITALEDMDGLERIRISSMEPTTIQKSLLDKMSPKGKLCRYLHIPLQSGHNTILELMKRKYTIEEFADFIQKAHAEVPDVCIGTDVIVGFPGEEKGHFKDTLQFLQSLPIHYFHVFSYSHRLMAKAKNLPAPVPLHVIQKRSQILRQLSQQKRQAFYDSFLGTVQTVLFEQQKGPYWHGLTDHYLRIKVKSNTSLSNRLSTVKLLHRDEHVINGVTIGQNSHVML